MRDLYQLWNAALTADQTTAIHQAALAHPAQDGTIFSADETMASIRSSRIRWLNDPWVRDLLWSYVNRANTGTDVPGSDGFGVTVQNQAEMQFTEYHADANGHYGWHHDINWNEQGDLDRKLSVTVQLSDPDDYTGGDFEFDEITTTADFRALGTILIFPAYLRHRVTPVTRGTRHSLVAWFSGPRWR